MFGVSGPQMLSIVAAQTTSIRLLPAGYVRLHKVIAFEIVLELMFVFIFSKMYAALRMA